MKFGFACSIIIMCILLKFMHFPEVAHANMAATTSHHYLQPPGIYNHFFLAKEVVVKLYCSHENNLLVTGFQRDSLVIVIFSQTSITVNASLLNAQPLLSSHLTNSHRSSFIHYCKHNLY